jgi:parallel beta-helix repeat protein
MTHLKAALFVSIVLIAGNISKLARADTVLINFESLSDGQNINWINLGGVTLTNPTCGIVEVYADNRKEISYHSATKAVSSLNSSMYTINPLVGVFDYPVNHIKLWAGDVGVDYDSWELEAFDAPAGGNSLGPIKRSGDWSGHPYRSLEINEPNIWRFEARWTGSAAGIGYDDLEFNRPVPILLNITAAVQNGVCVSPGQQILYTIGYNFASVGDSNVVLTNYLSDDVDYNSSSSGGVYNASNRTVTWNLGTIPGGSSGYRTLSVIARNTDVPVSEIVNKAQIRGKSSFGMAHVFTPVCNWGGSRIYVDSRVDGNGTSWDNAFKDINEALIEAARRGSCEIWVARGRYYPLCEPPNYSDATFRIPDGNIVIRGHFGGIGVYETKASQRNFNITDYETILDGRVGPNGERVAWVVTCDDIGTGFVLDGLTITGAGERGLYINYYSDPSIVRCTFTSNEYYGIYAQNYSYPDITDCVFFEKYAGSVGIYSDHSSWPYIKNSLFDGNYKNNYGLQGSYSEMTVENCVIRRQNGDGINFTNSHITLNRCTIEDNKNYGIDCSSSSNVEITDCNIANNVNNGINCDSSVLEITKCKIQGNGNKGVEVTSASFPTITNNIICNNAHHGISMSDCEDIVIKNNWIHRNGYGYPGDGSGLYLRNSISPPIVRNNTIVKNTPYGIYVFYGRDPCLINDIVYNNGTGPIQNIVSERGLGGVLASYCCIGGGFAGTDNISCDPCFRNPDTNDFHLKKDSNCIDRGDPSLNYEGEKDIDGHCRVMFGKSDTRVDIGADEFSPKADYNGDMIVNFVDFVQFAAAWKSTNAPSISLDNDNDVDVNDLDLFCNDWLWIAPCSEMYQLLSEQSEDNLNMSAETVSLVSIIETPAIAELVAAELMTVEEPVENQQQSMLENEGEAAAVWLVYNGNMEPNYGDEITVYIYSDANLFIMEAIVAVVGDANITSAMNEADCNNFGWENGWDSNPYIDPTGWVDIFGVSLDSFFNGTAINGTVGYLKFRYYGGEVSVSITADSYIIDNYYIQPVLFSAEPLIFGQDPNQ